MPPRIDVKYLFCTGENTLKIALNDLSIKAQYSPGIVYLKIQPKISHNQLIFQFLRKSKQQR